MASHFAPAIRRQQAYPAPSQASARPHSAAPLALAASPPAGDLLARARLLGHRVQRLVPGAAGIHAVTPGALQRVFDLDKARLFLLANPPAWSGKKPKNLLTSYRSMSGIAKALRDDTLYGGDRVTSGNLTTALEESWNAFDEERTRVAREKAKEKALKDARDAVPSDTKKHVLKGDFVEGKTTPTGYHSIRGDSTTHEAYGTKTDLGGGVYQQSVKGMKATTWVKKPNQSTFFPDKVGTRDATEDDVVVALGTGIVSSRKQVKYPEEWSAITLVKKGVTYYPAGGSDTLMAEELT